MKQNKLKIVKSADQVRAILHNTEIVRMDSNKVTLNSGGYKTNNFKTSINRVLDFCKIPMHVFIHEDCWMVAEGNGNVSKFADGITYKY